ncbi:MAG: GNAT family N-acetyltransferase [Oscillospiraceae bacterium]|nr:GNAT family N-acetyltransferase [Oscillospiraceae bacterium]
MERDKMAIEYIDKAPTLEEYKEMRRAVNFMVLSDRIASNALNNAFHITTVRDNGKAIGMIRVLSDGSYANFITDVIVIPEYQKRGIGTEMVRRTVDFMKTTLQPGETIVLYLMSAIGKESFYKQFGFRERPNEVWGAGMSQWITKPIEND